MRIAVPRVVIQVSRASAVVALFWTTACAEGRLLTAPIAPAADATVTGAVASVAPPRVVVRCGLGLNDHPALIIVDGVVRRGGLDLDPQSIVSVEVLKGPTAIARFGSEAQHGVVLVVTNGSKPKGT